MPATGQRMEVLSEAGLRDQAYKIIVESASQLLMAMNLKSTRHQPGGVQPGRATPITPGFMTYIGQIEAWYTMHVSCPNAECLSGSRRYQSGCHLRRQTRQHQRDQPATVRSGSCRPDRSSRARNCP
jgi:hypothetical protein